VNDDEKRQDAGTGDAGTGREQDPTRRSFVLGGAAVGAAGMIAGRKRGRLTRSQARLIERAATVGAGSNATLNDIQHVVILMQENRSFDHYFGMMSGVRGFSDPNVLTQTVNGQTYPIFDQFGYQPGVGVTSSGYMQPFNLKNDPPLEDGETTNDITHSWGPQHQSWNNGALDSFMTAHLAADGDTNGPVTMGYFTNAELAFYYALADAFTVCDGYFCSVLGPTDPNRIMSLSASIDPNGTNGGPVVETFTDRVAEYGQLTWQTYPEALLSAGVSWKVYNDPTALIALSPLPYFKNYDDPLSITGLELIARALTPTYPGSFASDVASGKLPSVSWILPPLYACEHPAAPPEYGEWLVQQVLNTLVSNPDVWAQTVLFVIYDENGGFFDHVPPVTAPQGTEDEWLTVLPSAADGIAGPIGLGFRTPCMVISPFSRGGYLCSDTFDHTSTLRFCETRFGVEVPNLSAWRRSVTGDLTSSLDLVNPPNTSVPSLPATSLGNTKVAEEAVINALLGTLDVGVPYPLPTSNSMPSQLTTPTRPPVPS
jgi:phospholipase C